MSRGGSGRCSDYDVGLVWLGGFPLLLEVEMRTYERPTLTLMGSFKSKTGLGTNRGPERLLVFRFSL